MRAPEAAPAARRRRRGTQSRPQTWDAAAPQRHRHAATSAAYTSLRGLEERRRSRGGHDWPLFASRDRPHHGSLVKNVVGSRCLPRATSCAWRTRRCPHHGLLHGTLKCRELFTLTQRAGRNVPVARRPHSRACLIRLRAGRRAGDVRPPRASRCGARSARGCVGRCDGGGTERAGARGACAAPAGRRLPGRCARRARPPQRLPDGYVPLKEIKWKNVCGCGCWKYACGGHW